MIVHNDTVAGDDPGPNHRSGQGVRDAATRP